MSSLLNLLAFVSVVVAGEIVSLAGRCVHPSIPLAGTLSCGLSGEEQALLAETPYANHISSQEPSFSAQNSSISKPSEASWSPWNLPPICTQTLEHINAPLCIYTSTTFAGGRGISIFTKPSDAEKIQQLPVFQDVNMLPEHGINDDAERPWRTENLPGRGVGMLATKRLKLGDRINAYTPVFVAVKNVGELITISDLEYLFRRAIEQLPDRSRDMFMNLARSFDLDAYKVQDIVATNSFEFDVDGEMHLALYPETSRINHDCGPNSQYHINSSIMTHYVHAARPIAPGEEISVSYSFPVNERSLRSPNLENTFHFKCTCKRCTDRSSDSRVARIASLEKALNDWSPSSEAIEGKGPRLAKELIKLYEKDSLHAMLVRPYGLAAQTYAAIKDAKNAKKYAKLAIQYGLLKDGESGEDVKAMRALEANPSSHWSWGARAMW